MKLKHLFFILLGLLILSCGPQKTISKTTRLAKASPKTILETHQDLAPDFKTLNAKLKGTFEDGKMRQSVNLSLRIQKNDTIWISAQKLGFSIAKLLVTPNGVQFYDNINGQYFDGDFSLLKTWLGVELNFDNFQNLLLGRLLVQSQFKDYSLSNKSEAYELTAHDDQALLQTIQFDRNSLALIEEHLKPTSIEDSVKIAYPAYFGSPHVLFPEKIDIIAFKPDSKITINLRYRSLDLNESIRFPFNIPDGYTEMKIKK